ncbi:MAG: ATP-binding protein [Bacteroidetes bacterium]|nr:ATP-binding protein [Bacteroidota bacterium]MCY4204932.1 ATP-binding protein [Bacteroidota bacterium]
MAVQTNMPDLVRRLIRQPQETEWLEFKSSDAEPSKIGQNISAIADATALAGRNLGYIVWGIHDESHQIIGTRFNPDSRKVQNQDLRF